MIERTLNPALARMRAGEVSQRHAAAQRACQAAFAAATPALPKHSRSLRRLRRTRLTSRGLWRWKREERKRAAECPRDRGDAKYESENRMPSLLTAVRDARWRAGVSILLARGVKVRGQD